MHGIIGDNETMEIQGLLAKKKAKTHSLVIASGKAERHSRTYCLF